MRNLLEYPATLEEVLTELKAVQAEEMASERIGGMRAYLMQIATATVERYGAEIVKEFDMNNRGEP